MSASTRAASTQRTSRGGMPPCPARKLDASRDRPQKMVAEHPHRELVVSRMCSPIASAVDLAGPEDDAHCDMQDDGVSGVSSTLPFPDVRTPLVAPLRCLAPLYGRITRRRMLGWEGRDREVMHPASLCVQDRWIGRGILVRSKALGHLSPYSRQWDLVVARKFTGKFAGTLGMESIAASISSSLGWNCIALQACRVGRAQQIITLGAATAPPTMHVAINGEITVLSEMNGKDVDLPQPLPQPWMWRTSTLFSLWQRLRARRRLYRWHCRKSVISP